MKWFSSLIAVLMVVVLVAPDAEAGRRSKCRSVSRCQTDSCSSQIKSSYSFDSSCSAPVAAPVVCSCSSCPSVTASYVSPERGRTVIRSSYKFSGQNIGNLDLNAWAIDEANRMADQGTNGHTKPAPVGYFVGVGCNGTTCQRPGPPIAEAHVRGKSVRVWRN